MKHVLCDIITFGPLLCIEMIGFGPIVLGFVPIIYTSYVMTGTMLFMGVAALWGYYYTHYLYKEAYSYDT